MYYSVASPDWKPGQPLAPAGALLFRSRSEAELFAPEAPVVAVAVRFDRLECSVRSQGPAASLAVSCWSAPAVGNTLGGLTVFGTIPAPLICPSIPGESIADRKPRAKEEPATTHPSGFGGWDSLTMALLA